MRKQDREADNGSATSDHASTSTSASKDNRTTASQNTASSDASAVTSDAQASINILEVMAPLTRKAVSLEQVPDPAFAEKQMGGGIAIEPS
ncbi:PTS glucose transporter subunit IIA, partial [Enterococcus faecium]|uniref:PTS glucose transporter subunit IIA n=1 Tax=Enterococcus faecium TaxID=1352 RepID=UPI0021D602D9